MNDFERKFSEHLAADEAIHARIEARLSHIGGSLERIEAKIGKQSGGFLSGAAFVIAAITAGITAALTFWFGGGK